MASSSAASGSAAHCQGKSSLTFACHTSRMVNRQDQAPPSDRRAAERMATTLRGKMFPGAVDCTIRDMSRQGARLGFAVEPPDDDPTVVVIWATGFAFEVTPRWRAGGEIGVLFHNRCDLRGRVPPHLVDIKAQWLGRRPQLRRDKIKRCDAIIGAHAPPSAVRIS